jgi:hypothetical protein
MTPTRWAMKRSGGALVAAGLGCVLLACNEPQTTPPVATQGAAAPRLDATSALSAIEPGPDHPSGDCNECHGAPGSNAPER